jgi:hypothetical protein
MGDDGSVLTGIDALNSRSRTVLTGVAGTRRPAPWCPSDLGGYAAGRADEAQHLGEVERGVRRHCEGRPERPANPG